MALTLRVRSLESAAQVRLAAGRDDLAAQRIAEALGFSPRVLILPRAVAPRRALARELRAQGWSAERIARVLRCSERTVRRCSAARAMSGQSAG